MNIKLIPIIILTGLFSASNIVLAESNNDSSKMEIVMPQIEKGTTSLIFGVGGRYLFGNWQGLGVAIKMHISKKSAIRTGIDVSFYDSDDDGNNPSYLYTEREIKRHSYEISAQYIRYFGNPSKFQSYWFTGPYTSHIQEDIQSVIAQTGNDSTIFKSINENGYSYVTAGLANGVVIEWFINNKFSFSAEYYGTIWMRWRDSYSNNINATNDEIINQVNSDNSIKLYGGGFATARMGMSLYF